MKRFREFLGSRTPFVSVGLALVGLMHIASTASWSLASGTIHQVSYRASNDPGELAVDATYSLWSPDRARRLRGIVIHQHGCGFAANASGQTAAEDLHWQALAAKWDFAILAPWYQQTQQGVDPCRVWCDPRNGSRKRMLEAVHALALQSNHPELDTVPWCLWGHSGGAFWASLMQASDPEKIIAIWFRSGTAFPLWDIGELEMPVLSDKVYRIPMMLNPGTKERDVARPQAAWLGSLSMFKNYREKGAFIGFAIDPLSGHDCGDSRYLAIPFFNTCIAMRLPDENEDENKGAGSESTTYSLRDIDERNAWLAVFPGEQAIPATEFHDNLRESVWLPNDIIAKKWMEYVAIGATHDSTPPPSPTHVRLVNLDDGRQKIVWEAAADFESGIQGFVIERDGQEIAKVPENPIGKFGRPLFQTMSSFDTPEPPLPKMEYRIDKPAPASNHVYRVYSINSVGLKSVASKEAN